MPAREEYVRVKEAAELLGVCPNTVRTWGAAGKLVEYRHPLNNYRLFRLAEIEGVLRRLQDSAPRPKPR